MPEPAHPDTLTLVHPLFQKLGEVMFRPAETDGTPVMVLAMGKTSCAVPLRALQAEMAIEDSSPDGQMFSLIVRGLDFVSHLKPGDPLPAEILCGGASWEPDPAHEKAALARLQLRLIGLGQGSAAPGWAEAPLSAVLEAAEDTSFKMDLQIALIETAAALSLPDAGTVARLVEETAREMAFVEALRDRLLRRVTAMITQIESFLPGLSTNLSGVELVTRVLHLAGIALIKTRARFTELDACIGELPFGLQTLEERRDTIRQHRDWLYCSLRGWNDVLAKWDAAGGPLTEATWPVLNRTYHFLACRFMPVQEWQLANRARRPPDKDKPRMVW